MKRTKQKMKRTKKHFKKLSLKQKTVTSVMGVGTIASVFIPIPGAALPPALATHKYIKRSLKKNKKNKKNKKKNKTKKKKKKKKKKK